MKPFCLVFLLSAIALFLTSCKTVEPQNGENRLAGMVLPSGPGVIWGRVALVGHTGDEAGAGKGHARHWVTDNDGGLADVFVWISRGLENQHFDSSTAPVVIERSDKGFSPRVAGVQRGQKVIWRARGDKILRLQSRPRAIGNRSFESLLMPNVTVETSYAAPEQFIRHETDLVSNEEAFVCVVDHPYFAVTDKHGMFALPPGLSPGLYTVTARHAAGGSVAANLVIGDSGNVRVEFEFGAPGRGLAHRVRSIEAIDGRVQRTAESKPVSNNPEGTASGTFGTLARPLVETQATPAPMSLEVRQPTVTVRKFVAPGSAQASFAIKQPTLSIRQFVASTPRIAAPALSDAIETRVFRVNTERLLKGLRGSGQDPNGEASLASLVGRAIGIRNEAKDTEPHQDYPGVVLNGDAGALQVRARGSDMARIEALLKVLDLAPAQVAIDARILEVDVRDFDRYIDWHPLYSRTLSSENFSGVLTESEFRAMLQRLAGMKGARLIHAPGVVALSGSSVEIRFDKETELSVSPTVSSDGQSVEMQALFATFAEGGDRPTQSLSTTARVMSRQTVMLGGLIRGGKRSGGAVASGERTVWLLLITPNVMDELLVRREGN